MSFIMEYINPFVAGAVILILGIIMSGYVKAPANKAFIISGIRKEPKILIGRAGIKIPFLERKDEILLGQISVDIKTNGYIPTKDFIGVDIDAVAKIHLISYRDVKGGVTREMAEAAMKNFLNFNEERIRASLTDSLQGNMREIIGTQTLKDLCNNRKAFGDEVQNKAQLDMNALGVWIDSCNIQKIEDENNLINALGQDNMSQIQKEASIAKAQADKEVEIARAEANKASNDANVAAQMDIAVKQNELAIRQADLKKQSDTKKAEANAAYDIQNEEQRKTIEVARTNADIAKQEREIELRKAEAEVKEQELTASVRKQAEADKFRRQQEAEAMLIERQKQAEAKRYEQEKEAEAARIRADAMKYEAQQEAEAIRAKGSAEAEAIKAKGIAEAEAMEKKAEAYAKYGNAAIAEMYFKVLPSVAENVAKPLQSIDRITMYGDGNSSKMVEDITKSTTQITEGLSAGLGLDIKSLIAGIIGTKALSGVKGEAEAGNCEEAEKTNTAMQEKASENTDI